MELSPRRRPPPPPTIDWDRLPLSREHELVREWLTQQAASGLAAGTVDAYSRAVERYLQYCRAHRLRPSQAATEHIAEYLRELAAAGLGGPTLVQRLTALRLFYAHIVERRLRRDNPAVGTLAAQDVPLASLTRPDADGEDPLPWIPDEGEWLTLLQAASKERPRTQLMLALSYDAALRREELCALRKVDLDVRRGTVRVVPPPASLAHTRQGRVVPLSKPVAEYCSDYLSTRAVVTARPSSRVRDRGTSPDGGLFLSESPRNRAEPISIWTWSKVVQAIGRRAGVEGFTTHTPRHLRLTDLARAGWTAAELARFAGQRRNADVRRYFDLARQTPGPKDTDLARLREEQLAQVLFRRLK